MTTKLESEIPRHLGIIVDGNRRWAKRHGIPVYEGHLAGRNTLLEIMPSFFDHGVEFVTLYLFSTENWSRTRDEVRRLINVIMRVISEDLHIFHELDIRLRVLGAPDARLSKKIMATIKNAEEVTLDHKRGTIAVCFNYGGQQEIADAVKKIVNDGVKPEDITVELISQNLYAPDIPSIDMVVRTSGEQRLSNFMLWRAAYSELMFIKKSWPDMTKDDVTDILNEYNKRHRRFGG